MTNPLLKTSSLPAFDQIQADQVVPALEQILADNRREIERLLQAPPPGWTLIQQLEDLEDRLNRAWSPVSHLNAVANNEALREAYNAALPLLSEYSTELGQNERLFQAYKTLAESEQYQALEPGQQQLLKQALRDFKLSGIELSAADKARYGELQKRLAELGSQFSENVLDATQAWWLHFETQEPLAGLPDNALALAAQAARQRDLEGYVVTLEFPSYLAVMTHGENRELRRQLYQAFSTRASDQGPDAGKWDNSAVIDELLSLRHALAQLLGYANYADYSLATKMARDSGQVIGFLRQLAAEAVPIARQELQQLQAYARERDGLEQLQAWDLGYYSEKLRQSRYAVSQEALRPYFPIDRVLPGLFKIVGRLYGIEIESQAVEHLWHEQVAFYRIRRGEQTLGYFYLDLYARSHKRGGAWMDECRVRRRLEDGSIQLPVAYLVCNFNPPLDGQPALLSHDDVTTLFHEFGHGLHHLLTEVDWAGVSGINGVPWDAVELPSQFLENWCWEPEALALISGHYQTGETLPETMLQRLLAARDFQAGMQMVRQLEFALFDFRLHRGYQPQPATDVQQLLDEVRQEVAVIAVPPENRFQHSFSHIFAGGYAAGYYSYKWAEVLSADAFSRFEREGVFNGDTGRDFLRCILSKGGSADPMKLFIDFLGREPSVDALLRHCGIRPSVQET